MANPICLSPLKFYDSLGKQERYKSYAYGHIAPVVMPLNSLHPFQFVLLGSDSSITHAYLYDAKNNQRVGEDMLSDLREAGLTHKNVDGYTVVMFPGQFPLPAVKYEGLYYLKFVSNNDSYYSEVFCFANDTDDYLEIEYWNPEADFAIRNGIVTFADNFKFKVLLKSELGKPEYNFEEEATERLGYNFIESQVSKKIYKFSTVLPEYLCDALRLIRLCSNKKLTSKGETYDMLSFDMSVDWQEQGDLASVSCEFEVDNIIVNFGGFRRERTSEDRDFNNDFNNDYK